MKILIVEDDPMVRNINKGFTKKINPGYIIYEAKDVPAAKEVLLEKEVDLLLLDVYLGNSSGPDLLSWIRENKLDVEVILITADNSSETVENAFRHGALDYLIKPFSFDRFKEAIEKAADRKTKLQKKKSIDQSFIDAMLMSKTAEEKDPMEKGINPLTYDLIMKTLMENKRPLTAKAVADKTDLARVTVRRYLEYMVKIHEAEEILNYGKVGRPQKTYILIDKGNQSHE